MDVYLSHPERYVFDLPGIGFKSYGENWTDVDLRRVNRDENKILVTYRDPSKINEELNPNKVVETLKKSRDLENYLGLIAGVGIGLTAAGNRFGLVGLIPYVANKLFSILYGRKIKNINVWNHFKQFYIEQELAHIYILLFKETDFKKGLRNVSKFARQKGMRLIAELYEQQLQ